MNRAQPSSAVANLMLAIGAAVTALVLLEVGLRVLPLRDPRMVAAFQNPPWEEWADPAWGNPAPTAYRPSPIIGFEHAPSVDQTVRLAARPTGAFRFRTNALGLRRDGDVAPRKPPGTRRVLVLGDSHTDGYVDNAESFATLLEAQLAINGPVEVLNAGVVGYSPAQEYLWYRERGAALDPDVVVLALYAGNDVGELADPTKPGVDPSTGAAVPPEDAGAAGGVAGPGRFGPHDRLDALRVVAWARAAVRFGPLAPFWRRFNLPGAVQELGDFRTETLIQVLRTCHGCFWQSLSQAARAEHHPERTRADLPRLATIATVLDRSVRADDGRLVVALLPTRAQVEPERADDERTRIAQLLELAPTSLGFEDEVLREVTERLRAADVAVVSLLEPLRRAAAIDAQYYARDWHLAPAGHRTVADALAGVLAKTFQSAPVHASR